MEKDPALGDTCADGRTRVQLVGADEIAQPSIGNYLESKNSTIKVGRHWAGKTGVQELLFHNPGCSGCIEIHPGPEVIFSLSSSLSDDICLPCH